MFLKNSFTFFFFTLWFVFSSFGNESIRNQKQDTISIPKLNIQEKIKENEKQITLDADLDLLSFQDQITIQREDGTYYYKVMQKKDAFSFDNSLLEKEDILVLLEPKKEDTLQTVILAIQTGKLVKNE